MNASDAFAQLNGTGRLMNTDGTTTVWLDESTAKPVIYLYDSVAQTLIDGGAGDDTIEGGGGIDWLVGGDGNDQVYGDFWQPTDPSGNAQHIVASTIEAYAGADHLDGGAGNDRLNAKRWFGRVPASRPPANEECFEDAA